MGLEEASSLGSKAISAGSKIAPIFGAYTGWMSAPEGANMGQKFSWIVNRLKNFKVADPLITTERAFAMPEKYPIGQGAGLYVTGYIINEIGESVGSGMVSGLGRIAKRGGGSMAVNALAASYFFEAMNNPHPAGTQGYGLGDKTTIQVDNPQLQFSGSNAPSFGFEGGSL